MKKTLAEIAAQIGGKVEGNAQIEISGIQPLHLAGPEEISFVTHAKDIKSLEANKAGALIIDLKISVPTGKNIIRTANPYLGFARTVMLFHGQPRVAKGINPRAIIEEGVVIGKEPSIAAGVYIAAGSVIGDRVDIYPNVYIGNRCQVGNDTTIYPNVTIYPQSEIGNRVTIHSNSVLGCDGFGYAQESGIHHKILQVGKLVIEDDVEVGAGTTIDRATLGETRVGAGTKIDNQVNISNNATIGHGCSLGAQVSIGASAKIGNSVAIWNQAGITGHIAIGDKTVIGARSGVTKDVHSGDRVLGSPAVSEMEAKRALLLWHKLPDLRKKIQSLEKNMIQIQEETDNIKDRLANQEEV